MDDLSIEVAAHTFSELFPVIGTAAYDAWKPTTLRLLHAAHFTTAKDVKREPAYGIGRHDNGQPNGEEIVLNDHSGIAVFDERGPHADATEWLDVLMHVYGNRGLDATSLRRILDGRRPFEPIRVNAYGDTITARATGGLLDPLPRDEDRIGMLIHVQCSRFIERVCETATHGISLCSKCYLRLPIPKKAESLGALRTHFGCVLAAR